MSFCPPNYGYGMARTSSDSAHPSLWLGLVSGWTFSDGPSVGKDWVGGNHAAHTSCSVGTGLRGRVITYDGTNGTSMAVKRPTLDVAALTVSVWVKFAATPSAGKYPALVCKAEDYKGYTIFANGDYGQVYGDIGYSGAFYECQGASISGLIGKWVNYVLLFDPRSAIGHGMFENGAFVTPVSTPSGITAPTNANVRWAQHYSGNAAYGKLNGQIAETLIWNRGLTLNEIRDLSLGASPFQRKPARIKGKASALRRRHQLMVIG